MRYQYVVVLKKTSERAVDLLSVFFCISSAFLFLNNAIGSISRKSGKGSAGEGNLSAAPSSFYYVSIVAIILLGGLAFNLLSKRNGRLMRVRYRYLLVLAGIGWIALTSAPWVGPFFFLLAFLEFQAKRPLEIGFDQDRVVVNTLFRQRHDWSVFNNIVLKDGLLTMDFKNNRLLQREVDEEPDEDDADEEEFNAYCRERLKSHNQVLR